MISTLVKPRKATSTSQEGDFKMESGMRPRVRIMEW